jgi:serralysin
VATLQIPVTQNYTNLVLGPDLERLALTHASAATGATGNGLANTIIGNAGANIITGGGLADTLTGGGGIDRFVYKVAADSISTAYDYIKDFQDAGADLIDLAAVSGAVLSFVGSGAFTTANQVRAIASGADVFINVNLDANLSTNEMTIRLATTTLASIAAGDFVL